MRVVDKGIRSLPKNDFLLWSGENGKKSLSRFDPMMLLLTMMTFPTSYATPTKWQLKDPFLSAEKPFKLTT